MQIWFTLQIDCEATQRSINDPDLGERAIRGLGEILCETGLKGTFVVIPQDLQVHARIYRELEAQGVEISAQDLPGSQKVSLEALLG